MKTIARSIGGAMLLMAFAFAAVAQTGTQTTTKPAPAPKPAKTKTAKPTSDADIQACITKRLAAAPKLKDQGLSATVSGGTATFTGVAANAGSKGGVSGIAKACGATKVVNNITVKAKEKVAKPAATPKPAKTK